MARGHIPPWLTLVQVTSHAYEILTLTHPAAGEHGRASRAHSGFVE